MKNHIKLFVLFLLVFNLFWGISFAQEDYDFDISEIEKKPYQIGGYLELRPVILGLARDTSLYKLKFYNHDVGKTIEEYNAKLQLDGSYEWDKFGLYVKTNSDLKKSYLGWSDRTSIYEGYISIKPSFSFRIDIGKRQLKWGKGYAWNPVAFVDRAKNPDDPEISLEGFIVAKADYIMTFDGPLKSLALTPVLFPVYRDVNDDFGKADHMNFAFKTYMLFYDTDIDLIFFTGESKNDRYGIDFSRNIMTNFEIHGEFAFINNSNLLFIDSNGHAFEKNSDAENYLIGVRYLTESDTTFICEYYHNGTGFNKKQIRDYFLFIDKGYENYLISGDDSSLKKALNLTENIYGRINPMRDYLYLRVSQKEPFDILYFVPSLTMIYNFSDKSFSFSPELLYSPVTNMELRFKMGLIAGEEKSEYGEKQNNYKIELRGRYYF